MNVSIPSASTDEPSGAGGAYAPAAATASAHFDMYRFTQASQQTQSQPEMLTQNPDLTQTFGDFGDDDDEDDLLLSPYLESSQELGEGGALSSSTRRRIRRRRAPPMPWGRLVPCGGGAAGAGGAAAAAGGGGTVQEPAVLAPIDLMPRPAKPQQPVYDAAAAAAAAASSSLNGSRSTAAAAASSNDRHADGGGDDDDALEGPRPGDVFNEYVIGRSARCDVVVPRQAVVHHQGAGSDDKNHKLSEWVYALVSNKHARIYCLQSSASASSSTRGYEVYVEDTSHNGTVVNGTVLRKCERRILNSGDEVCLANPQIVQKKIRSPTALQHITQQYSFVFVAQQQPLGVFSALARGLNAADTTSRPHPVAAQYHPVVPGMQHHHQQQQPMFSSIKPAVDPRAVKSHSFVPPAPRHNDNMPAPPKVLHAPASGALGRYQPHGGPALEASNQSDLQSVVASSLPPTSQRDIYRPIGQQNARRISPRRQPTRRVEEDYDIRDLLGSGTTGEVRRAIERRTGIQRAVKIIPVKQALGGKNSADATAAILAAEANLLQQLDHPYVVKLINVYSSPTAVCLVMELLHGGDLFDRIVHKGRYSEVEARRVMRRLLSAMHYLHEERHIVHRDLKPENILLRSRESDIDIQITDFGLAKAVAGGDGLKTFCGTATYCAPEILQRRNTFMGRGRYNKQADQWSLGVILYILLSGCQPFDGDQWMAPGATPPPSSQVPDGFVSFPEEFWADVSELACDLVRQMLVVDPKKRISVRDACNHPWILLEDGDTHGHPLEDPRIPRSYQTQAIPADANRIAVSNGFAAAFDKSIESPDSKLPPPFRPPLSPGVAVAQCKPDPNTDDFKLLKVNKASSAELGPGSAGASDQVSHKASHTEDIALSSIALLAHDANKELSDDEIHSQFSEKTDTVSSFDASETSPAEYGIEGVAEGRANSEVIEKENALATCEKPRKRRVTASVSSAKSPKARKSTPAPKNGPKPKKTKKAGPPEPATTQSRKQTTLSDWLKQK